MTGRGDTGPTGLRRIVGLIRIVETNRDDGPKPYSVYVRDSTPTSGELNSQR